MKKMTTNMPQENKPNPRLTNKIEEIQKLVAEGKPIPRDRKVRVAVLADSPTVVTGFGNVAREVLKSLYDTGYYEFDLVGINYDGSPHDYPYRIWPAMNALMMDMAYRDVFGRQQFLDILGTGEYDIVWVLQDTFIVQEMGDKIIGTNDQLPPDRKFAFVLYFPIDATPKKDWIDGSALLADLPVAYTKYAYDETLSIYHVGDDTKLDAKQADENRKSLEAMRAKLNVIYHGVNTDDFYPLEDEKVQELKEMWNENNKDKFIFINVNRNQPRKDMFRTMLAFKKLLDRRRAKGKDDVRLYTHCSINDTGLNLIDMSKQIDLVEGEEWMFPDPRMFTASQGVSIEMLNKMYNAADCVISTTLGEGWGLSITEAMATKRPVIAPDHTSIREILGRTENGGAERGLLIKTYGEFVQSNDNSRVRPLVDVDDMVDKMEYVVEHREELKPMVDRAYDWVQALKWNGELVGAKWNKLFESAYYMALAKRGHAVADEAEKADAATKEK